MEGFSSQRKIRTYAKYQCTLYGTCAYPEFNLNVNGVRVKVMIGCYLQVETEILVLLLHLLLLLSEI